MLNKRLGGSRMGAEATAATQNEVGEMETVLGGQTDNKF